jgi:hypothetical protein
MRNILLVAMLSSLGQFGYAEVIKGSDDPTFRAPFERLLKGDDPAAVAEIHAAAENGNHAALLALPAVLTWMPPQGTLAERKRFRSVSGVPMWDAIAAVSPVGAAWANGGDSEAGPIGPRIDMLIKAGEPLKAQALYGIWLHEGLWSEIPLDREIVPSLVMFSFLLTDRLQRGHDPADSLFLAGLLAADRAEGWGTFVMLFMAEKTNPMPPDFLNLDQIIIAANVDQNTAATKIRDSAEIRQWYHEWAGQKSPDFAAKAASVFRGRPEFSPIEAFCKATCAASAQSCEAAWLFLNAPYEVVSDNGVPEAVLVSTEDFFATPRGGDYIFPIIRNYKKNGVLDMHLSKAESIDSCLVQAARDYVSTNNGANGN